MKATLAERGKYALDKGQPLYVTAEERRAIWDAVREQSVQKSRREPRPPWGGDVLLWSGLPIVIDPEMAARQELDAALRSLMWATMPSDAPFMDL